MRNNPNITIEQLAKIIGISSTTIDKNIKILRNNKIIRRDGSNKFGIWIVEIN